MKHQVFIALGTNLGERTQNLEAARKALPPGVQVTACSPIYETPPWGYADQPAFLNQVIQGETDLPPHDLLGYLKQLEAELGRTKTVIYGPRVIDLDIIFYDDLILETPTLTIPHPRLVGRAFVLVPLADLAPDLRHPKLGKTVHELREETDSTEIKLLFAH
jgi:2-amino-4-hydroxy-6-hydroxymethyldihydropteridine diphosphokinase